MVVKKLTILLPLLAGVERTEATTARDKQHAPPRTPFGEFLILRGMYRLQSRCASVANERDVPPCRSPPDKIKFVQNIDCTHSLRQAGHVFFSVGMSPLRMLVML